MTQLVHGHIEELALQHRAQAGRVKKHGTDQSQRYRRHAEFEFELHFAEGLPATGLTGMNQQRYFSVHRHIGFLRDHLREYRAAVDLDCRGFGLSTPQRGQLGPSPRGTEHQRQLAVTADGP
jgi:hypothetical protein